MKKILLIWLIAGLLFPMGALGADMTLQTGFSYQGWSSDEDESGYQLHFPIQVQSDYDRFSWDMTAGYAVTSGDLAGESEQSISGLLDTQAGAAYLLPAWGGVDLLLGLDLNLPTGRTGKDERQVRIMIDPDLVGIISPGQGFNINPTVSIARQWEQWAFGLGVGYAWQGEYDFSDQTRDYDPGDMFSIAAKAECVMSPAWKFSLQSQYLTMGADRVEDEKLVKKGDAWQVGAALQRTEKKWQAELAVQGLFRGKAEILNNDGQLITESRDSQGDELIVNLAGAWQWRPQTRFTAGLKYLHLDENGYDSTSAYYMGRRGKIALSLGWMQQLSDTLDLQCGIGGFIMDDDPSWLHPDGDRQYHGWSATAALARTF